MCLQARLAHPDIVRRPDEADGLDWAVIVADDHILLSAVYLAQDWTRQQPGKHAVVRISHHPPASRPCCTLLWGLGRSERSCLRCS